MIADDAQAVEWVRALDECTALAMERLERFVAMLGEENARQNLVSAQSLTEVWRRHIADSAQLLRFVPRGTSPWLDLGSGAGLPGIVVATLRPDCEVLLIESRKKRIAWLKHVRDTLGLTNVTVLGYAVERVEDRSAAVITARAFAPLEKLLCLAARFSTEQTRWVLPKGRSAQHEVESLRTWRHTFHVEQSLTDPDAGIIVGSVHGSEDRLS